MMQQRVTAILVVQGGADRLERTLGALASQTRAPDRIVAVDIDSKDRSRAILAESDLATLVSAPHGSSFGRAVSLVVDELPPDDEEWLWLLGHDNAPAPDALAEMLAAVELSPSVAVAAPKLMRWTNRDVIAGFGESMTRLGAAVHLVEGELDQAQHDSRVDVLGAAAAGMLIRRSVWASVQGFDPALPSFDAGLDLGVRVRLAGHRVALVPAARIATAGGPEHFGRPEVNENRRARLARRAQLHRRLVYAPALALPFHWLMLLPVAIIRSLLHLLTKHPGFVPAEFAAAFGAAFSPLPVYRARRRLKQAKQVGWSKAVAPLRLTSQQAQEFRARHSDMGIDSDGPALYSIEKVGFVRGGGLWVTVAAAVAGVVGFGSLLSAASVVGGGLVPLAGEVSELWSRIGWGWRPIDLGFLGAADPFSVVLALLGSITFWNPSSSIVLLYLLALPLAAVAAWHAARYASARASVPALVTIGWVLAPPFLASLHAGQLGAVLAHILLPWLVISGLRAARSWTNAATAALLLAAIVAGAPSIAPALVLLWIVCVVVRPSGASRLLLVPLPAAVLAAPLVIDQVMRGTPWALLADPVVPTRGATASASQLLLGSPGGGSAGWERAARDLLPGSADPALVGAVVASALVGVLVVLALLSLFTRDARRAVPAMLVALLGVITALAVSRVAVSIDGDAAVGVWAGASLSLLWLGLLGAAVVTLDRPRAFAHTSGTVLAAASVALALPLLSTALVGASAIGPGLGRILPAFVDAESDTRPGIGTLVLAPVDDDSVSASVERGEGTTLDAQSTLYATDAGVDSGRSEIASLAGNLVSRSGADSSGGLDELGIGFVVLTGDGDAPMFLRAQEALDANAALIPVGETTNGLLWRYTGLEGALPVVDRPNTGTAYGIVVLVVQAIVFGITVLLAVPTRRRRAPGMRTHGSGADDDDHPVRTFDEDDDDD